MAKQPTTTRNKARVAAAIMTLARVSPQRKHFWKSMLTDFRSGKISLTPAQLEAAYGYAREQVIPLGHPPR